MSDADPAPPARRPRRAGLYAPFILLAVAVAAWSGWREWLAREAEARLLAQVETLRASGWTVEHGPVARGGWPFRVRLATAGLKLTAPSGHAVGAPELAVAANAYRPDRWLAVAPQGLTLTRGEGKGEVAVTGRAVRLSVHGLTQRWPNVALELAEPVFTAAPNSAPGAEPFPLSRAGRIEFYMRPHLAPGVEATDDVDVLFRLIDAEGRPGGPVEGLSQDARLTAQMEAVVGRASALRGMDAAGVLSAWSRAGGRFTRVRGEIRAAGSRAVAFSDDLAAGPDGRLVGEIALTADRPAPAIAGLARSGSDAINPLGAAAAASATAGGPASDVELKLVFARGRTLLGPFTLGPAPRLF